MIKAAVLGYGTVGSGVVEVLHKNKDIIAKRVGQENDQGHAPLDHGAALYRSHSTVPDLYCPLFSGNSDQRLYLGRKPAVV